MEPPRGVFGKRKKLMVDSPGESFDRGQGGVKKVNEENLNGKMVVACWGRKPQDNPKKKKKTQKGAERGIAIRGGDPGDPVWKSHGSPRNRGLLPPVL